VSSSLGKDRILLFLIVALVATTAVVGYYSGTLTVKGTAPANRSVGPYRLTAPEIMNTPWNVTTAQPKFYIVGPGGLESSANITFPVNTPIELTIVSYDTPTLGSTDQQGVVNGTVDNTVYLINGTTASMSSMPSPWGQAVTSVPGSMLAHTFTIPQLGVNIPVVGGDTEIVHLYFTKVGTFTWFCLTPCGFGPNGSGGAMSMPGWMTGMVTIS
jgi:heme/copper-type cytochrome/quinol oxidase subunit 2